MTAKEIGEKVKILRVRQGFNKNALAAMAGISPTYINDIENGKKCPTVEVLSFICNALNVTLAEFFTQASTIKRDAVTTLTPEQKKLLNDFLNSL